MQPGIYTFQVLYEPADTDEKARPLGVVQADTAGEALERAEEVYKVPSHDLTVKQASEHLIMIFPNPLMPTTKKAEAYAKTKIGQFLAEQVEGPQKWLILTTRVVVDREEPLAGRVLGMCVQVLVKVLDLPIRSTVYDYPEKTLEITDTDNIKYFVAHDKQIEVIMIDLSDKRVTKTIQARQLAPFMSKGYIIERIKYEE